MSATWRVLVIDMFHYQMPEDEMVISGFPTEEMAAEYARRRTRDSLEELREPGMNRKTLRERWLTFGEDCLVLDGSYKGFSEIDFFCDHPATAEERDWVGLAKAAGASVAPA